MSDIGVLVSLDDQSIESSKVVLDYTSRDFTAIRSQLIGLAQGLMPDWKTVGEDSDFGTLLLELFSYMGDVMNFYIDRTASEAFLGTAVRRQSVLYIADMLGYTPIGQQAASVNLVFSLDAEGDALTIPKGSRVHNSTNDAESLIVFETNLDLALNPGDIDVPVFATEGVSVRGESLGTARGVPNAEYILPNKGVVYGSITVTSQEAYQVVDWSYVSDLANARPTQSVFTTYIDEDTYTHVVFGDNTSGRIPPVNCQLSVSYRFGKGAAANSLAAGDLDTLVTIPNLDTWAVSVTNLSSPVGGTDPESIESMRYSIPRSASRLKQRAITLDDFADLAMQVPGVAKSVAYGAIYTAVRVRIAPQEGKADTELMQRLCLEVSTYLADKVLVGSTVYVEPQDPDELWLNVYIRILVHVVPSFNRTSVRLQVDTVVRAVYAFNSVDFGTRISVGQVYRAILAVQGVEWAELQWLSDEAPSPDPTDETQTEQTMLQATWALDTNTTMALPATGFFRRNSPGVGITALAFNITTSANLNVRTQLLALRSGDHLVYRNDADPTNWLSFMVTATPTDNTTWVQVAVALQDQSATWVVPPVNTVMNFDFLRYTPNPYSSDQVDNIETPELLIPRIEPTEIVEDETDYPTFTEDERTHDGLWVIADQGLPNT